MLRKRTEMVLIILHSLQNRSVFVKIIGTLIAKVTPMVLRIDTSNNLELLILTLSGRLENERITELQEILASQEASRKIVFDLKDVTLVDQRSVEFLAECVAEGAELWNCPAYLQEWIQRFRKER